MIHEIIIPFVWLIIPLTAILIAFKIRTNYKIAQVKQQGKEDKKEESISGSINKFINDAPKQLKQIESEIATIQEKGRRERIPEDQIKKLTERLESEKDMLSYAVKYGGMAKPLIKPFDKIITKLLGNFTGEK